MLSPAVSDWKPKRHHQNRDATDSASRSSDVRVSRLAPRRVASREKHNTSSDVPRSRTQSLHKPPRWISDLRCWTWRVRAGTRTRRALSWSWGRSPAWCRAWASAGRRALIRTTTPTTRCRAGTGPGPARRTLFTTRRRPWARAPARPRSPTAPSCRRCRPMDRTTRRTSPRTLPLPRHPRPEKTILVSIYMYLDCVFLRSRAESNARRTKRNSASTTSLLFPSWKWRLFYFFLRRGGDPLFRNFQVLPPPEWTSAVTRRVFWSVFKIYAETHMSQGGTKHNLLISWNICIWCCSLWYDTFAPVWNAVVIFLVTWSRINKFVTKQNFPETKILWNTSSRKFE